jgi:hypothetical protein
MRGKTIMGLVPECGRNMQHNPILDENDWYGYDHGDSNSLRVFGAMVGPNVPSNLMVGSETNPIGSVTDFVPTIAEILGFKDETISAGHLLSGTKSLFDRI